MAQYIDKDALVAEIEKLIERAKAERVLHPKTILAAKNYLLIEDYKKLLSFIDSMQEEPVSKDLDEAAKDYINNVHVGDHHIRTNAFKAGALWQREKMLKDAVEAHAFPADNEFLCDFSKIPYFDTWEKVKLIVVKED